MTMPANREAVEQLHALVEQLAGRFRGYLPWGDDLRTSTVRSHEMFIKDAIKKADALHDLLHEPQEPVAWLCIDHMANDSVSVITDPEHARMRAAVADGAGWTVTPLFAAARQLEPMPKACLAVPGSREGQSWWCPECGPVRDGTECRAVAPAARQPEKERSGLLKFYAVNSVDELIDAMAHHIEKLQAKLPPMRDEQPGRVREG